MARWPMLEPARRVNCAAGPGRPALGL